ncbi:MAG: hypothetical protein R3F59_14305 [Myxococcota bacterium]
MNWKEWIPTIALAAIFTAVVAYNLRQRGGGDEGAVPVRDDRAVACTGLAGTPDERLEACLADLPTSPLSAEAKELLTDVAEGGKLLAVATLPDRIPTIRLADLPDRGHLMGTDEAAAASALRDAGVRGIAVARDLTQALDRDNVVLARLAHHDFIEWFQLRRVTDDLLVYTVRKGPAHLPVDTADQMLRGLRARLEHRTPEPQRWAPPTIRIIGTARLQGRTLVTRHVIVSGGGGNLVDRALDELAAKMTRDWERKVEVLGVGPLDQRLPELRLEIHVVMEKAPVEPRSRFALFDLWEMGVDGMMFRQRAPDKGEQLDEKFTYMPGSELLTRSMRSADEFLRTAVSENGWNDRRPWEKDTRTRLDLIRDQHFMEATPGGGPAVRLVRGMPEVPLDWVTDEHVQDMLIAGGEWWLHNQEPSGKFLYKYWPNQNRRSTDYNEVRHILGIRDLADVWRYRQDPRYLDGSRKAMDWLLRYAVDAADPARGPLPHPPAGTMLFRFPAYGERMPGEVPTQKLGTDAVAILGWIAWAESTGSHAEDERIRKMAKFVLSQQDPDGRFTPYYVQDGHPYKESRNDIVPGEAMLALGMVAEYFDEPQWIEPYDKFVAFYEPWFRERAQRRLATGRWPQTIYDDLDRLDLVQFGPWSVMAAKQVHKLSGSDKAAKFGLDVADWMIDSYQWSAERSPWPDYVGGYYKLPEELPAMQTFCYSEGTAAAYTLASRFDPSRAAKYEQSTREAIRFLELMQFDDLDSYFVARPDIVRGGIKYTMNENKVRIDYVGHGMSTLSQWLDGRRENGALQPLHDPTDLQRPAGTRGSVPGLDYGEALTVQSGEIPQAAVDGDVVTRPDGDAVGIEAEEDPDVEEDDTDRADHEEDGDG